MLIFYCIQQNHEQVVNKLKKAHKAEVIKLQQLLKVYDKHRVYVYSHY